MRDGRYFKVADESTLLYLVEGECSKFTLKPTLLCPGGG